MRKIGLRTWVEVSKSASKKNYTTFRKLIGGKKCLLMVVVKSNAYGHGLVDFSKIVEKLGADWFGVDSIVEALALRKNGVKKPILVFGYTLPENFSEARKNNISLTVSNFEGLKNLKKLPVKFHIKIDTGMHRQGFLLADLPEAIKLLKSYKIPPKFFEGIYTHFAAAKNPAFPKETIEQLEEFKRAVRLIEESGFNLIKHAAATSSTILFPQTHFDMVRVGIGLYGLWPSKETQCAYEKFLKLSPVLSFKTIIGEIKNLPRDSRIGYDFTETLFRAFKVAVCPVGYWHGYSRMLSSIGNVLIKNRRAKVLGRVSMDMIVVDITGIKGAKVGDEVVLIGRQGKEEVSVDEIATLTQTVNYEAITRLNPLIKRFYL